MLCAIVLAVGGIALLAVPHGQTPSSAPTTATPYATTGPATAASAPAVEEPATGAAPPAAPAAPSVLASALAPHGEGVAGDRAIQRALEVAWPADLPAADERELLAAGRAVLRADATGVGRARWPTVFPDADEGLAPAFATAGFRIQAAIARREGGPGRAVVHLVWAGMDRGGTFTDLRITDWSFTRTMTKGVSAWTPQPRT